jgi:hypothetical protein
MQLLALAAISVRYLLASCWPGVKIPRRAFSTFFDNRDPADGPVGVGVEGVEDVMSCGSGMAVLLVPDCNACGTNSVSGQNVCGENRYWWMLETKE